MEEKTRKTRKKNRKRARQRRIRAVLCTLISALILIFGVSLFWRAFLRPALTLTASEASAELGSEPAPLSFVKEIKHASEDAVTVTRAGAKEGETGEAVFTYSVRQTKGFSKFISLFPKFIRGALSRRLWAEPQELVLSITDTTPPVLTVKDTIPAMEIGSTLSVDAVVAAVTDLAGAEVHFADGSDSLTFTEAGDIKVGLFAVDRSGNRTEADVSVSVLPPDTTAPEILGAGDIVMPCGSIFEVMGGVTARDDRDSAPALTAAPSSVNTDYPGTSTVLYTARDSAGNESSVLRRITVAENVLTVNGVNYAIHWDTEGIPRQPYLVTVNRTFNTVTIYEQDDNGHYTIPVKAMLCSVGDATPAGYFRTEERNRWKELFGDCYGQYSIRITGHILFHSVPYFERDPSTLEYDEFNLLGTPASLGCVRLCVADEKWLYDNCPAEFPCCIYDEETSPGPLGKPEAVTIDTADSRRGWDPTDPNLDNPWNW